MTTRLTARFRAHLKALRTRAYQLDNEADSKALLDDIDALAGDMAMQFPVVEQVELPAPVDQVAAGIEAARAELGIVGLLDDTEPMLSAARDNRVSEVA